MPYAVLDKVLDICVQAKVVCVVPGTPHAHRNILYSKSGSVDGLALAKSDLMLIGLLLRFFKVFDR